MGVVAWNSDYFELDDPSYRDYVQSGEPAAIAQDQFIAAKYYFAAAEGMGSEVPLRIQTVNEANAAIIYTSQNEDKNMLDREYLLQIQKMEEIFIIDDATRKCTVYQEDDKEFRDRVI